MSKKFVTDFTVVSNQSLNSDNFLIVLQSDQIIPAVKAGQFVNIDIPGADDVFLRRPFSIFNADYDKNRISVLVKIAGNVSKQLTEILPGSKLNLIHPLGTPFTYPADSEKILAIGGGSGLAPILFLASTSNLPKGNIDIILGARSSADHIDVSSYDDYANIFFITEDGSKGEKGLVTDHSLILSGLEKYDRIYACGPKPMMIAVAHLAKEAGIFCEVSLENLMACGFGVCLCCIEPTVNGNVCVCTEGPVFNINKLKWQI